MYRPWNCALLVWTRNIPVLLNSAMVPTFAGDVNEKYTRLDIKNQEKEQSTLEDNEKIKFNDKEHHFLASMIGLRGRTIVAKQFWI